MSSRWKNLNFRLLLIVLSFCLAPLAGFGLFAINYSKNSLVEFQTRASFRTVDQAAVLIEEHLDDSPEATLHKVLREVTSLKIGREGSVYIVDNRGRVVAHPDADTLNMEELAVGALAVAERGSKAAVGKRYVNSRGVEVLGVARSVRGTDWLVIAELPMAELEAPGQRMRQILTGLFLAVLALTVPLTYFFVRRVTQPLRMLERGAVEIGAGRFGEEIPVTTEDEIGRVSRAFNQMAAHLRNLLDEASRTNWLKNGLSVLDDELRGTPPLEQLTRKAVTCVAGYIEAPVGALYINQGEDVFTLAGGHAHEVKESTPTTFLSGQGLVGQAAYERRLKEIVNLPTSYLAITSSLGSAASHSILLMPLIHNEIVVGVLEVGGFAPFSILQKTFLEEAAMPIAVAINAAQTRLSLQKALESSQRLTEELQTQQEELRVANEELEEQTQQLQGSEEELKAQHEILQAANAELEEKTFSLEERQLQLARKNDELLATQKRLEQQARELEVASRYKSEFLANMSHELRTPLNSLLILAQDLAANKGGRLNEREVESAGVIYRSGHDLLKLISEILDLSKIEAGRMEVDFSPVPIVEIGERLLKSFRHLTEAKGLDLNLKLDGPLPESIRTDIQRADQILKNLMSNAIKFTEAGSVNVRIFSPTREVQFSRVDLQPDNVVAIEVTDTGIGVPQEKLQEIFRAFHQVDGSISRKYGGTGLGLSISKELSRLLGGELRVESRLGSGSTFTLYLPLNFDPQAAPPGAAIADKVPEPAIANKVAFVLPPQQRHSAPSIADDRDTLLPGEKTILIVEDDLSFAAILAELCHERQFKYLHAGDGETALQLIEDYPPDAVLLDIRLPGIHGLDLLALLKEKRDLRHLPVHVISVEECAEEAYQRGAVGFLRKPTTRQELSLAFEKIEEIVSEKIKTLLVVENDPVQQQSIISLIGSDEVEAIVAETGKKALETLRSVRIDCMIVDLKLPDMTGFELLEEMERLEDVSNPPVIIYTGRELTRDEEATLQQYTSSIIIKGAHSPERLLDEASLFLHKVVAKLPAHKQQIIDALHYNDAVFSGKKILLVDDDMRTVFAIAKVLEERGVRVLKSANGQKALEQLAKEGDIDLVLMDIMMPVMDGYEAMRHIRGQARFRQLPILALTAKAMREDRQKCIEAGANDYLPKPVDMKKLFSLLRVWLHR